MKSTVETLSPTRVRLDIEVPYAELTQHVSDAYKKVASQVNIPGFRKGKIPASMIDQRADRSLKLEFFPYGNQECLPVLPPSCMR